MRQCRCFRTNPVIRQLHGIISGRSILTLFIIAGTVSFVRILQSPGKSFQWSNSRHYQEIPQIAIPANSRHLRESESFNRCMFITVSAPVVTSGDCIRTYLYHSKRCSGTGKCLSKSVITSGHLRIGSGTDERIHIG